MSKNTLTVSIGGREYTLSTTGNEDWTRRVAAYVDQKISEISLHSSMSTEIAAVVAALSITEELFEAQDTNQKLRNRLYQTQAKEPSAQKDPSENA